MKRGGVCARRSVDEVLMMCSRFLRGRTARFLMVLWFALAALPAGAAEPGAAPPTTEIEIAAERVVENFRKLIVLHDGSARTRTAAAGLAGRVLFYRNRELTAQLVDALTRASREENAARVERLLALLARRRTRPAPFFSSAARDFASRLDIPRDLNRMTPHRTSARVTVSRLCPFGRVV